MGSFLSLEDNKYNKYDPDTPNKNEIWTLTPENTSLTESTLNLSKNINDNLNTLSKNINTGLTNSYNTIYTSTEDIFSSINKGLKNLLDLSVDSIDYVVNKTGLYKEDEKTEETTENITQSQINQYINSPTSINNTSTTNLYNQLDNLQQKIEQKTEQSIPEQINMSSEPTIKQQIIEPTSDIIEQPKNLEQQNKINDAQLMNSQYSTISSVNTSQLSTLNLNDNNISTTNLNRF